MFWLKKLRNMVKQKSIQIKKNAQKSITLKADNMKKLIKNYYKPTPKKWRKIGDALLASATLVCGGGLLEFDKLKEVFSDHELKLIIGISFIIGVVGKFLTNLFTKETK